MKVKITEQELNECITNAVKRILSEGKDRRSNDFEKVTKKSNREIERDNFGNGFKPYDKIHKSIKDYSRKGKNKKNYMNNEYDLNENIADTNVNPIYPNEKKNRVSKWSESPEFVDYVTIKTDIDPVETTILDKIRNNFTDVELEIDTDVVTGKKNFNVTKDKKLIRRLIDFLKKNDVNIIE